MSSVCVAVPTNCNGLRPSVSVNYPPTTDVAPLHDARVHSFHSRVAASFLFLPGSRSRKNPVVLVPHAETLCHSTTVHTITLYGRHSRQSIERRWPSCRLYTDSLICKLFSEVGVILTTQRSQDGRGVTVRAHGEDSMDFRFISVPNVRNQ